MFHSIPCIPVKDTPLYLSSGYSRVSPVQDTPLYPSSGYSHVSQLRILQGGNLKYEGEPVNDVEDEEKDRERLQEKLINPEKRK